MIILSILAKQMIIFFKSFVDVMHTNGGKLGIYICQLVMQIIFQIEGRHNQDVLGI
jgi:hypothetical protein